MKWLQNASDPYGVWKELLPRHYNQEQTHVNPAKESELLFEITPFERQYETHEPNGVESEADHAMIRSKW